MIHTIYSFDIFYKKSPLDNQRPNNIPAKVYNNHKLVTVDLVAEHKKKDIQYNTYTINDSPC